jgi:hypothetical protein
MLDAAHIEERIVTSATADGVRPAACIDYVIAAPADDSLVGAAPDDDVAEAGTVFEQECCVIEADLEPLLLTNTRGRGQNSAVIARSHLLRKFCMNF